MATRCRCNPIKNKHSIHNMYITGLTECLTVSTFICDSLFHASPYLSVFQHGELYGVLYHLHTHTTYIKPTSLKETPSTWLHLRSKKLFPNPSPIFHLVFSASFGMMSAFGLDRPRWGERESQSRRVWAGGSAAEMQSHNRFTRCLLATFHPWMLIPLHGRGFFLERMGKGYSNEKHLKCYIYKQRVLFSEYSYIYMLKIFNMPECHS